MLGQSIVSRWRASPLVKKSSFPTHCQPSSAAYILTVNDKSTDRSNIIITWRMFFVKNIHLSQIIKQHSSAEHRPQQERGHATWSVVFEPGWALNVNTVSSEPSKPVPVFVYIHPSIIASTNTQISMINITKHAAKHLFRNFVSAGHWKKQQQNTTSERRSAHFFKTTVQPVVLLASVKRQPVLKRQYFVTS